LATFPVLEGYNKCRESAESVGAGKVTEMSMSLNFRRQAVADRSEHVAEPADSRMDKWARARGAALLESVVVATRRNG
jgi:hypothetical protein